MTILLEEIIDLWKYKPKKWQSEEGFIDQYGNKFAPTTLFL